MSSSSFGIPHFLSFLFISTLTCHGLTTTNSFISRTCKKCTQGNPTLSYNFCVNSLEASPNSHRAKDLHQLGNISFMLLRRNLTNSRSYIKQLLNNKKMESPVRVRVNDCLQLYSDAILDTKEAFQDYNAKRYQDSNIHVSAVSDAPVTCEDGFKEIQGLVSPLTNTNNVTFQLCAISLSILTLSSA